MTIRLPQEVLGKLPAPDSQGIVRATVSLRMGENGEVSIEEINDEPVPIDDEEETEKEYDDEQPMPADDLPDLDKATAGFAS